MATSSGVGRAIGPTRLAYAAVVPFASVAQTVRPIVFATSLPTSVYVADVAPWTALQRAPFASQRYHWNAYFIAPEPVHVPVCAVSRRPTAVVPATLGLVVTIGPVPRAAPCAACAAGTPASAAIAGEESEGCAALSACRPSSTQGAAFLLRRASRAAQGTPRRGRVDQAGLRALRSRRGSRFWQVASAAAACASRGSSKRCASTSNTVSSFVVSMWNPAPSVCACVVNRSGFSTGSLPRAALRLDEQRLEASRARPASRQTPAGPSAGRERRRPRPRRPCGRSRRWRRRRTSRTARAPSAGRTRCSSRWRRRRSRSRCR